MKQYLIIVRPYGMLFLGFTPVFSALANNEFTFLHLAVLFIIGILLHIFGFVQNDYYDLEIDSKSKYVSNRPLTSGHISKKTAFIIFTSAIIISLILAIGFFSPESFVILFFSIFCMALYNKYSKKIFGMEYVLGIGVFILGIFGALSVSNNVSTLAIIISLLGCMQWLFSVGVSANLKDVEFDTKLGIKTTPTILGVRILGSKFVIPPKFVLYAFSIKIIHIFIAILPFLLGFTSPFIYNTPIPLICFIIVSIIIFYLTKKILSINIKKRDNMLIYVGLQEGFALLLIPIILMNYLIDNTSIFILFLLIFLLISWPIFWFRILFGRRMIPLE